MSSAQPYTVSASAHIDAPPDRVYGLIADYRAGHPRIVPDNFRNFVVEKGGIGAGTVIRFEFHVLGQVQSFRSVVSEPEPGRVLVERNVEGPPSVSTFIVSPDADGSGCTVTISTEMMPRQGIAGAIERFMTERLLQSTYPKELALLAALASQQSVKDEVPPWLDRAAYPFRHRYMDVASVRLHYVDEGTGEPIVFVHGTPTWSFEFRHLIAALSPQFRCIALDLPGFGLSSRPTSFPYTPEAHSRVVAEFIQRLNLPRFTLVVHDFGGPIALPVAMDHPEQVRQLVILNTWMWSFDDDPDMGRKARLAGGAFGRFLYKYANASLRMIAPSAYATRAKLTPEIHRQYLEPFRRREDRVLVLHALARALLGSSAYYDSLWRRAERLKDCRVLIVWGMKDSAFRPNQLERWVALLPQAQVVRLPGAGHWPHEEEPAQVMDAVRAFLTAL